METRANKKSGGTDDTSEISTIKIGRCYGVSSPKEAFRIDRLGFSINDIITQKEVTLEYPSGVKLSVDATDLSLIAQSIRLLNVAC